MKVTAVAPDTIKLDDADRAAVAQPLPLPHEPQPGLGRGRAAELRRQRHARLEPAARAQPALPAHRLRQRGLPGRDPARLRDAPAARAARCSTARRSARLSTRARSARRSCRRRSRRSPPPTSPTSSSAVTITQEPMDTEEMSRLWSAIQAHYRPTASYVVSVVLIEARSPSRTPLPVLSRGPVDPTTGQGSRASSSSRACCRRTRRSSAPSRPTGSRPRGSARRCALAGPPPRRHVGCRPLRAPAARRRRTRSRSVRAPTRAGIDVPLPSGATAEQDWPAGVYIVTVALIRPGEADPRDSNVAAHAARARAAAAADDDHARRDDAARDRHARREAAGSARAGRTVDARRRHGLPPSRTRRRRSTLTFDLGDVPPGAQWVRLDGRRRRELAHRPLREPPAFDPGQSVAVPA